MTTLPRNSRSNSSPCTSRLQHAHVSPRLGGGKHRVSFRLARLLIFQIKLTPRPAKSPATSCANALAALMLMRKIQDADASHQVNPSPPRPIRTAACFALYLIKGSHKEKVFDRLRCKNPALAHRQLSINAPLQTISCAASTFSFVSSVRESICVNTKCDGTNRETQLAHANNVRNSNININFNRALNRKAQITRAS